LLARLIDQSLAALPEIAEAQALLRAQRAQAVRAGAWPEPMLQLGMQNDGFTSIELGQMEGSYLSLMVSQTIPWPGRLKLRSQIAELGARQGKEALERLRIATEAEVRRSYLDLLWTRERQELLRRLEGLWSKTAEVTRARYETGSAAQSDLLRAQLEVHRLKARCWTLDAEEQTLIQRLNRLRGHSLQKRIETTRRLRQMTLPRLLPPKAALVEAYSRSPELAAARLGLFSQEKAVQLAQQGYYPDLVIGAGIMPRGGGLPTMWLLSLGVTLPVFAASRQRQEVEENQSRLASGRARLKAIEQSLRLREGERRAALAALGSTIRLYRDGLLIQSEATAESTLAQYQVGKVSFASVLEAIAGYIADEEGYLQSLVEAQRLTVAEWENSLDPSALFTNPASMGAGGKPASRNKEPTGAEPTMSGM
jgi:outer membrane protein TolC